MSRGYVVASPATRGRTNKASDGNFIGKAPAVIVDLQAATAYLHANDATMPGNAKRIITNGTSAGGAVSLLQGATGNTSDYQHIYRLSALLLHLPMCMHPLLTHRLQI